MSHFSEHLPIDVETFIDILDRHIPGYDDHARSGDAEATARAILQDMHDDIERTSAEYEPG